MGKKRKSVATQLDEVDRTMYSTFSSAASSLSQLYTQAMNQQKLSFQAGERHALDNLHQWILGKHEEGSSLSMADIVAHLQNEIDCVGEDTPSSPRIIQQQLQQQQQHSQQIMNTDFQTLETFDGGAGHGHRTGHSVQTKNSTSFPNDFSGPICRILRNCQLPQTQGYVQNCDAPSGNNTNRNTGTNSTTVNNRGISSPSSHDSSMDMH